MEHTYVVYKSVTGFTQEYAEAIAKALSCEAVRVQDADLPAEARVIYGGRMLAGTVDGWMKFKKRGIRPIAIFGVGAMPDKGDTEETIWKVNLTAEEQSIPHFYFQGGLRYNKMPVIDWLFMKMFSAMTKKQMAKDPAAQDISRSFSCYEEGNILPLVEAVKSL